MKKQAFYKGTYIIVFYDIDDERLLYMFDNTREIVKFTGREVTKQNVNLVNVMLYRALRTDTHIVRFLTGELMRVYIIEIEKEALL